MDAREALAESMKAFRRIGYGPEVLRDHGDTILSALSRLEAAEWRAIESAPRDGSVFVVANFTDYPADDSPDGLDSMFELAKYLPYTSYRYVEEPDGRFRREAVIDEFACNNWHQMTHWMPLPSPPSAAKEPKP